MIESKPVLITNSNSPKTKQRKNSSYLYERSCGDVKKWENGGKEQNFKEWKEVKMTETL